MSNIFDYEVNGVKMRLVVTDRGFTLWDEINGTWLIDASRLAADGSFSVGQVNPVIRQINEREFDVSTQNVPKPF
jgi:hypothetical protein